MANSTDPSTSASVGVSAILTAAGESSRMGSPKPLLDWHGVTLVEYQVGQLFDAGVSEVIVVLGHRADEVVSAVSRSGAKHVINDRYRQGKTTSVIAGLSCIDPTNDAILLLAVDQPRTSDIISQVIQHHLSQGGLITSPRYEGHGGHPLIFSATLNTELSQITEDRQGIREVFEAHRDALVELPIYDPMIRLDINTPQAYKQAKAYYGA